MAHFWRSSKGIVTKSLQFQKCFSRSLRVPKPAKPKPTVNISPVVPGNQVENLEISDIEILKIPDVENLEISDPLLCEDTFNVRTLFTVKDLFNAGVHCGHTMHTLNEHMKEFILEERQTGMLIFDLDKTAERLYKALHITAESAFRRGIIMITRYKQNTLSTECIICGDDQIPDFWYGVPSSDPRYFSRYPDLIIYLNTLDSIVEGQKAIKEANDPLISTIGVVNTDCSPNAITYPIPGNDDNPEALDLYYKLFKAAIVQGNLIRSTYYDLKMILYHSGRILEE